MTSIASAKIRKITDLPLTSLCALLFEISYIFLWINFEISSKRARGHKIVPVEVKSSGYKTHKSIDEFCVKFASQVDQRYLVYTKDLRKDGALFFIPAYMCMFI